VQGFPLDGSERVIAGLRRVTAAEVQAVAAKYFGDDQMTQVSLLPQPVDPNRKPRKPALPIRHDGS
jgi:zinc protease